MVNKFEHMFIRFDLIHESEKNRRFHVPQPTFLFPLQTPLRLSRNMLHGWRQFNACLTPRSMYLSIFNSFRVKRCLSQCVSPKIAIFTTFLFPLETPKSIHRNISGTINPTNKLFEDRVQTTKDTSWVVCYYLKANTTWPTAAILKIDITS